MELLEEPLSARRLAQARRAEAADLLAAEDHARLRLEAAAAALGTTPPKPPLLRPVGGKRISTSEAAATNDSPLADDMNESIGGAFYMPRNAPRISLPAPQPFQLQPFVGAPAASSSEPSSSSPLPAAPKVRSPWLSAEITPQRLPAERLQVFHSQQPPPPPSPLLPPLQPSENHAIGQVHMRRAAAYEVEKSGGAASGRQWWNGLFALGEEIFDYEAAASWATRADHEEQGLGSRVPACLASWWSRVRYRWRLGRALSMMLLQLVGACTHMHTDICAWRRLCAGVPPFPCTLAHGTSANALCGCSCSHSQHGCHLPRWLALRHQHSPHA